MDHQFASSIPFNTINNNTDHPVHCLPSIPYEGLHRTQSLDTMPALGDGINHLMPAQHISTYSYTSVPDMTQRGPDGMQQVFLFDSTTSFQDNGYRCHHLQQTLTPDTGTAHDTCSCHDEGRMQFAFSIIDSKPPQISDQNDISPPPSPTEEATASKKCEWEGCTFPRPFRRDAELLRHIKTVHVPRDAYKCPICARAFGRKDKMEDHRRIHIGKKDVVVPDTRQIKRGNWIFSGYAKRRIWDDFQESEV